MNENETTINKLENSSENIQIFSNFDIPAKALNIKRRIKKDTLNIKKNHKILKTVEYGNDEIILSKGIIIDEETTEVFLTKNQRWAQMYKLLVFQFCRDFAEKCKL